MTCYSRRWVADLASTSCKRKKKYARIGGKKHGHFFSRNLWQGCNYQHKFSMVHFKICASSVEFLEHVIGYVGPFSSGWGRNGWLPWYFLALKIKASARRAWLSPVLTSMCRERQRVASSSPLWSVALFTQSPRAGIGRGFQCCLLSKATGKGQPRGRALAAACWRTEPGSWEWPKTLQHRRDAGEPGATRRVGLREPGTQVDPAPRAVQGQVKPRNAWLLLLGEEKDCSYHFL